MLLGIAKAAVPANREMASLESVVGIPASVLVAGYWALTCFELLVGAGLLAGRRPDACARASFVLSAAAGVVWIAVVPLRSGCPCLGALIRLSGPAKAAMIAALFGGSFALLWRTLGAPPRAGAAAAK